MNIEEKIIFLEDYIEKLNLAIYSQDKKISELEKTIKLLYQKIQDTSRKQNADEKPPHY